MLPCHNFTQSALTFVVVVVLNANGLNAVPQQQCEHTHIKIIVVNLQLFGINVEVEPRSVVKRGTCEVLVATESTGSSAQYNT